MGYAYFIFQSKINISHVEDIKIKMDNIGWYTLSDEITYFISLPINPISYYIIRWIQYDLQTIFGSLNYLFDFLKWLVGFYFLFCLKK